MSQITINTIKANDTWAFYQAKSIKQTLAEKAEIIKMLGQQLKQKGQPKKVTSVTTAPKKVGRPKGSKNRVKK